VEEINFNRIRKETVIAKLFEASTGEEQKLNKMTIKGFENKLWLPYVMLTIIIIIIIIIIIMWHMDPMPSNSRCLQSHYLATAIIQLLILWSLPSNGSTCHNNNNLNIKNLPHARRWSRGTRSCTVVARIGERNSGRRNKWKRRKI
jgi:hypothetical protein